MILTRYPLVKQGAIPKHLAGVFVYTPPPQKKKSKSKIVKYARIVTSDEVIKDVKEAEEGKNQKKCTSKESQLQSQTEKSDLKV